MKFKDKLLILVPSILSLAASLTYLTIAPPSALALCGGDNAACVYAGQCYSNGACVNTNCIGGNNQMCINGSFTNCAGC